MGSILIASHGRRDKRHYLWDGFVKTTMVIMQFTLVWLCNVTKVKPPLKKWEYSARYRPSASSAYSRKIINIFSLHALRRTYFCVTQKKSGSHLRNVTKVKTPLKSGVFTLVNSARFEPATFGSASQRSIQLSYESIITYPHMLPSMNTFYL